MLNKKQYKPECCNVPHDYGKLHVLHNLFKKKVDQKWLMIPQNCTFCGLCCTLTVRLSGNDIRRIEKSGHKKDEFVVADADGKPLLKRENGWCTFFKRNGKVGLCTIYDSRPGNCRDFPGKRLCDLAENPIYKYMDKNNEETKRIMQLRKNAPTSGTPEEKITAAQKNAEEVFSEP